MNDKSKTTLVCGTANCIRSHCLWGLMSHSSCALVWYEAPQNKFYLIQVAVPHTQFDFPVVPASSWVSGAVSLMSPLHGSGRPDSGPLKLTWPKAEWLWTWCTSPSCLSCLFSDYLFHSHWSICSYTLLKEGPTRVATCTRSMVHMVNLFCCICCLCANVITVVYKVQMTISLWLSGWCVLTFRY